MVTDFHSHILPKLDDGSHSPEESIAMLHMAMEQGISRIVLTPHFYPQRTTPERFLSRRAESWQLLRSALTPDKAWPELILGAEVHYYPNMSQSEALKQLTIQGTPYLLVEMPTASWTDRMYRELELIHENLGLTPIVAHVDRYLGRFLDHGIPRRLSGLPVLVQANAEFFLNRATASKALQMLHRGQIHLLGSDCHDLSARKPNLGPALEVINRKLGAEVLDQLRCSARSVFSEV